MTQINWTVLLHHALTVVGFVMMPILWLGMNCYGDRTSIASIFSTWNQTRRSGEPWGWFDRNYRP